MITDAIKELSVLQVVLGLLGTYVVIDFIKKVIEDGKIRRLGGRAPIRRGWLPFGIDIAYQGMQALLTNRTYEYFLNGQ